MQRRSKSSMLWDDTKYILIFLFQNTNNQRKVNQNNEKVNVNYYVDHGQFYDC